MSRVDLQEMVGDIRFDGLPVNWNAFDIVLFSRSKALWDYQRKAVEKAQNENLDEVYIPYYDGSSNKVREFKPDFIFWLQKGNTYFVVFIDPKGTVHTDYERKIDGYAEIFESSGHPNAIPHENKKVKVFTFLYTSDVDRLSKSYKQYWFDDIDKALATVENAT